MPGIQILAVFCYSYSFNCLWTSLKLCLWVIQRWVQDKILFSTGIIHKWCHTKLVFYTVLSSFYAYATKLHNPCPKFKNPNTYNTTKEIGLEWWTYLENEGLQDPRHPAHRTPVFSGTETGNRTRASHLPSPGWPQERMTKLKFLTKFLRLGIWQPCSQK